MRVYACFWFDMVDCLIMTFGLFSHVSIYVSAFSVRCAYEVVQT